MQELFFSTLEIHVYLQCVVIGTIEAPPPLHDSIFLLLLISRIKERAAQYFPPKIFCKLSGPIEQCPRKSLDFKCLVSPKHDHVDYLTLSPMAEKHRPYYSIGLTRPRAMTIVAGIYPRRRVLSLVPVYEVCDCKWGGAPCTRSTFLEIAPRPEHMAGPMEESEI